MKYWVHAPKVHKSNAPAYSCKSQHWEVKEGESTTVSLRPTYNIGLHCTHVLLPTAATVQGLESFRIEMQANCFNAIQIVLKLFICTLCALVLPACMVCVRVSEPLQKELQLWAIIMWLLEIEPGSSEQSVTLITESFLPAPQWNDFLKNTMWQ